MTKEIKPVTREEIYLNYLLNGGKSEDLPMPISKVEQYLYYLCLKEETGGGNAGATSINIIDNLTSKSTTEALSANQGRILNEKIPDRMVKNIWLSDFWRCIVINWTQGQDTKIAFGSVDGIAKSINTITPNVDGTLNLRNYDKNVSKITTPYIHNADLNAENGTLTFNKGDNTIKTIDLKGYIQSVITGAKTTKESDFTHYYKLENGKKIEITEDEFNQSQCHVKYFKEIDNELIEVTEEEFFTIEKESEEEYEH